jgi:hypothetical protein
MATPKVTSAAPKTAAEKKPAAKKPAAAKAEPAKKTAAAAKPAATKKPAAKKAAAPKAAKSRKIGGEERYRMIEVAAYFLAERNGFKGNPVEYWTAAEIQISKLLSD